MTASLEGRRIIVTGASSGIGLATARISAARGARVALMARTTNAIDKLAGEFGGEAVAITVDVADADAVDQAVAEAAERFGGLDGVVNAAGVDGPRPLADVDAAAWRLVIDTNLSGSFYVARAAALRMESGSIVNVGSELSSIGMGMYVHYCASKAGVLGLTKALAAELAPRITVNAICPGPVDTPMMDAELEWFDDPEASRKAAIERVPLKRFATPDEVADAICFLLAGAPFATGATLAIDGGTTAI